MMNVSIPVNQFCPMSIEDAIRHNGMIHAGLPETSNTPELHDIRRKFRGEHLPNHRIAPTATTHVGFRNPTPRFIVTPATEGVFS